MSKKYENFFSPNQTLILRNYRGERRLHYSRFHQYLAGLGIVFFSSMSIFLSANFLLSTFMPANEATISESLLDDYDARIQALITERENLSQALTESRATSEKLVRNLGEQQDLLFDMERTNYELQNNLSSLRETLVATQNRVDLLDLELETQHAQLVALESGEGIADTSTLSSITSTLAETAQARDEARSEVQVLRQEIALNEQKQDSADRRREVLFDQIEEAIETSLVPMKSTLSKTGLNVDQLLNNVRRNSGIGGLTNNADLSVITGSAEGARKIEGILDGLDELANLSYLAQTLPLGKPVQSNYRMSSGFGYRRHPISGRTKMHSGQDMAGPVGTPIYATGSGKVIQAGRISGYGKTVKIQHANGIQTLYGHMSRIRVKNGQSVKLGERIGDMGSTGQSTGSHLHYEVIVNGVAKNPMNFLRASNYVQ